LPNAAKSCDNIERFKWQDLHARNIIYSTHYRGILKEKHILNAYKYCSLPAY